MSDDVQRPQEPTTPDTRSNRVWFIVIAVVVIALLVAILVVLLQDDEGEETSTGTSTTAPVTELSTSTSEPAAGSDEPEEVLVTVPPCSADALLAAADGGIDGVAATVTDHACTTEAFGVPARGYAWAVFEAVEELLDPLTVYFAGEDGSWDVLDYGTDVVCDDLMPAEACDQLPAAQRP